MNRLLAAEESLAILNRFAGGIRAANIRVTQLDAEKNAGLERLQRQATRAATDRQRRLDNALADAEVRRSTARADSAARTERRTQRLHKARQTAHTTRSKAIETEESRLIFQIQRDLLQTTRDRDAAGAAADQALAAVQEELARDREASGKLLSNVRRALGGYPGFVRLLTATADTDAPPAGLDPSPLLAEAKALVQQAEQQHARFRRRLLPAIFSWLSPWWTLIVLGVALALGVWLAPRIGYPSLTWPVAGATFAATSLLVLGLYGVSGRLARHAAETLAQLSRRAGALLDAADQAALAQHQQAIESSAALAQARTLDLEQRWTQARETAEHRRNQLQQDLDAKLARALRHNDAQRQRRLAWLDQTHADDTARARAEADQTRLAFEADLQAKRDQLAAVQQQALGALRAEWDQATQTDWELLNGLCQQASAAFPAWDAPGWSTWTPPLSPAAAAPVAHLSIDMAALAGAGSSDPRLPLPGPQTFSLPLLLVPPGHGSLVIETDDAQRPAALTLLNQLVLRLLASSPPGHALFTLLDPVGLGESFAGLMHLADHEDRLINRRIWTQPDQIDQRLADLNEHVEKVTQLYLRNAYQTIADYNAQAGRIAEPFHFLVVADFPAGFSDTAIRRLLSLASSGPRCGVFLLLHWDQRRPAPPDLVANDLRNHAFSLRTGPTGIVAAAQPATGTSLVFEPKPTPAHIIAFLQRVGRASIDSNRVQMPFVEIAPQDAETWTLETSTELRVPIGITGATRRQQMALGKGTRQHALIAGKTGSGKSTLFHVLITNLALWYSPDEVQFYLVDFKKGVEFKCYASHRLPHARVVAIESDREFALSVLQHADAELHRRGDLFRHAGAQDLAGFLRSPNAPKLPRTILLIDEFQEFFTEDDRVAQGAALLLDRLVRQGRAFGIHVILGSQTLGGAYTLARTTLGQMAVRIALQCNEADALLIMDDNNTAPRLLSRPGEAIYNDSSGALEGNSPFQIAWLPEDERDSRLQRLRRRADTGAFHPLEPVVFEGNAPADIRTNPLLRAFLDSPPPTPATAPRAWLGAPNAIKGPTEVPFLRQSGSHLLVLGQNDESALALLASACLSLSAQHTRESARFILVDATPSGTPQRALLETLAQLLPQPVTLAGAAELPGLIASLAAEMERRADPSSAATAPSIYLVVHHLERFKAFRFEEDFGLSLSPSEATPEPGAVFNRLLQDAATGGLHVLASLDTYASAMRTLGRRALGDFDYRVLFQMSASDSASLIDSPKASTLGLHRALLNNAREGSVETFRPYAIPDAAWLEDTARRLAR